MEPAASSVVRPPAWTGIAARLAGLWILAGCLAKALYGSPADLPAVVRHAPLALGTTFALVIGIEAFVGIATLARPGRAWPLAALLLLAFAVVLSTQIAAGARSCGCFGSTLPIPPWAMLAADLSFLALLLFARPWRLPRGGVADLAVALVALGIAVALPRLTDREATPGSNGSLLAPGAKRWVTFDVASWKGQKVTAIELARWADLSRAHDGLWIVYKESCEYCAGCLEQLMMNEKGARDVTLVKMPESGSEPVMVHMMPQGGFVHRIDLTDTVNWNVTPPLKMIVEGGVVTFAKEGVRPDDCP